MLSSDPFTNHMWQFAFVVMFAIAIGVAIHLQNQRIERNRQAFINHLNEKHRHEIQKLEIAEAEARDNPEPFNITMTIDEFIAEANKQAKLKLEDYRDEL